MSESPAVHRWAYQLLILTAAHTRHGRRASMWNMAWARATPRMTGTAMMTVHGARTSLNTGHAYPAFSRRWPYYNRPLVALVRAVTERRGHPLVVVDVGAGIGDTVLLLMEEASPSDSSHHYVCVEPDVEFMVHLQRNLGDRSDVEVFDDMLADVPGSVASLVRTHSGTASAQGVRTRPATTLDALLAGRDRIDVVKIDTDGYDGRILAGAASLLETHRPHVIFEWHPILLDRTGNDVRQPFDVIAAAGYELFAWFTKEGDFSHVGRGIDARALATMAEICRRDLGPAPDWHYDVVALPPGGIDVLSLLER